MTTTTDTTDTTTTSISRPTLALHRTSTVAQTTPQLTQREQEEISQEEWRQLMAEFLVFLFAIVAIILNVIVVASCRLLVFPEARFIEGGYGLFLLQPPDTTASCRGVQYLTQITSERYPNYVWNPNDDEVLAFAQVGGLVSIILGVILVINIMIRQFAKEMKYYRLVLFLTGMGIQVTLGWVHLIWWSKGCDFFKCTYGQGMTILILCHLFWLFACLLTKYMRPSKQQRKHLSMSMYTSQLRLQIKERENRYEMEYLPVAASILIMSLFIYLALHNIDQI